MWSVVSDGQMVNFAAKVATGRHEPPESVGAPPSFDEVYDAHIDYLWRSARAMGIPVAAVEDVLQDVFVVVHRRLQEYVGRDHLRSWLTRILVRVIQQHRRRFRRKEDCGELPSDVRDDVAPSPHEEVVRREAAALLMQMLDRMQDDQRLVFVLAEIEGVAVPEIAAALEISPNTVYSRLRLARGEYARQTERLRAREDWKTR